MYISKKAQRVIISSIIAGGLVFVPAIYAIDVVPPIIQMSIVSAEIKKYTGVGESIVSDRETLEIGKQGAKMQAIRNAQEQAGIFVSSYSKSINGRLTEDEIMAFTAGIIKINDDVQYELISLNNSMGTAKYRATVTVTIDTNDLNEQINEWMNKNFQERSDIVNQNNELQRIIEEQARRIKELEQTIANAQTQQDKVNIQNKISVINNETLYNQRLEEGNKLREQQDYNGAILKFNEAIQLNPDNPEAYKNRGMSYCWLIVNKLNERENGAINNNAFENAVNDLNKAIELNPNDAWSYFYLGRIYEHYISMKQHFYWDYVGSKDYYPLFNLVIENYTKAIELNPNFDIAYNNRGVAYAALTKYDNRDYTKAINDYNKAIEINPNYVEAYYNRGIAYQNLKKYTEAIAD